MQQRSCHTLVPCCSRNKFLPSIILFIVVIIFTSPASSTRCSRASSYRVSYRGYERCSTKSKGSYTVACGTFNWGRCTRYRYTTSYHQCSTTEYSYRSRTVYYCCSGWTGGGSCPTPICSLSCLNGGTCSRPGHCSCRSGYTGSRCQTPVCSPVCQNRGTCSSPGRCSCTSGYIGSRCETPVCSPVCRNGGTCSSPGHCSCRSGYIGNRCQTPECSPGCRNGGTCSRPGFCSCRYGYIGNRCQTPICSPGCQNDGTCSRPGFCSCTSGYIGNQCQTPICSPGCQNGGTCEQPDICSCINGYTGISCEEAVTIRCPNDVTKHVGYPSSTPVRWDGPQITGGEGYIRISSNHVIGSQFSIGVTQVHYSVYGTRDILTTSCSFSVQIILVTIACPPNVNTNTNAGMSTALVTWSQPAMTPNNGLLRLTTSHNSGGHFPIGMTTVTYDVLEIDGLKVTSCDFDIFVSDTEIPSITCPDNTITPVAPGGKATITWNHPVYADNSGFATLASSHAPGDEFHAGNTMVTYTVWDRYGNQNECHFTISVKEINLICPDDISALVDGNISRSTVNWDDPPVIGVEGLIALTSSHTSGHQFPAGITKVSYIAQDIENNAPVTECSFNVEVIAVYIYCPEDITVPAEYNSNDTTVDWIEPLIHGVEHLVQTRASHTPGERFYIGTTLVNYDVVEEDGSVVTNCRFSVTVVAVNIDCPEDILKPNDLNMDNAIVFWNEPYPQVEHNIVWINSTHRPGERFRLGTTTVTYEVFAMAGQVVANCSFNIQVFDTDIPSITCPDNSITPVAPGGKTTITWNHPAYDDNTGVATMTSSHAPGDEFQAGNTMVTYTVWDPSGNQNECNFTINVKEVNLTCPDDISVLVDGSIGRSFVNWDVPPVIGVEDLIALNSSHTSGHQFPAGITTVSYIAQNIQNNVPVTDCSFNIEVIAIYVSCPEDITVPADYNSNYTTVDLVEPLIRGGEDLVQTSEAHTPGERFYIGTNLVNYDVVEEDGTIVTNCSFNVTVVYVNITCPEDILKPNDMNMDNSVVFWNEPLPYPQVEHNIVWVNSTHRPGKRFMLGTTTVTYEVFAMAGQVVASCTFNISVFDKEKPIIACPDDVIIPVGPGKEPNVTWDLPTYSDNSGSVTASNSHTSGTLFPVGRSSVWYRAVDPSGNTQTCNFEVNVTVVTIQCPNDLHVPVDDASPSTEVSWKTPTPRGGEGYVHVTGSHMPSADMRKGITWVTHIVVDNQGDVVTACNFTVIVHGVALNCSTPFPIPTDDGRDSARAIWDAPVVSDGQKYVNISSSHIPGEIFHIGVTTVTYGAYNLYGEIVTDCSLNITVLDTESPIIICPSDILVFTDASMTQAVEWNRPNATDNSGVVNVNCSHYSGRLYPIGLTEVYCQALDDHGNMDKCNFTIVIEGVNITCPDNIRAVIDRSAITSTVTWSYPEIIGGLDQINVTVNIQPGHKFPVGHTVIEYIVFGPDMTALTSCGFDIIVYDPDKPTLICPDDIYRITENKKPKIVFWKLPDVLDLSGTGRITFHSHKPGDIFTTGSTDIRYEATDFMGKTGHCSFSVTVEEVIVVCPEHINTTTDAGSRLANVTWNAPEVIDEDGFIDVNVTDELWQLFPIGDTSIVYDIYDTDGSVLTNCTFEVTVEDNERPTIICPADIIAFTEPSVNVQVYWDNPLTSDNSGNVSNITSTFKPGDMFQIGSTNVSYTVQDRSGNHNRCNFVVVVEEVIIVCPSDVSFSTGEGVSFAHNITWLEPTLFGGRGKLQLASNRQFTDQFELGDNTIVYTASHGSSNVTQCSFTLSINDLEPPQIRCPNDVSTEIFTGNITSIVTWDSATAGDNSGQVAALTSNRFPGEQFPIGSSVVTYTAFDSSDNRAYCSFNVSVSVLCLADVSSSSRLGKTSWSSAPSGTVVDSKRRCPIDSTKRNQSLATRRCSSDARLGAIWKDPEPSDCGDQVTLTLGILGQLPVEMDNIVEIAEALDNLTNSLDTITSHDVIQIIKIMDIISTMNSSEPQIPMALVDTAGGILSTDNTIMCDDEETDDFLSIQVFRQILTSVDHQLSVSSKANQLNIRNDVVNVNSYTVDTTNESKMPENEETIVKIETHDSTYVTLQVFFIDACSVKSSLNTQVYDTTRIVTLERSHVNERSRGWMSAIVSPIVSVQLSDEQCLDTTKTINIEIPLNQRESVEQVFFDSTARCVSLNLNDIGLEPDWSTDNCNVVDVTGDKVTCKCRRIAVYAVMMDYYCSVGVSVQLPSYSQMVLYSKVACYVVEMALFISIVLVMSTRNWPMPTHQKILFHLYLSLFCLFSLFILVGHLRHLPFDCVIVRSILHYLIITSLMWFAIDAQCVYMLSVAMATVGMRFLMPICCLIAWLLPVALVGFNIYLSNSDDFNEASCIVTVNVVGHLTLILPACMILLHNTIVYLLTGFQILKEHREHPLRNYVCSRLGEAVCMFALTSLTVTSAYHWVAGSTTTYQIVFSAFCLTVAIFILCVNIVRIRWSGNRSGRYQISTVENDLAKTTADKKKDEEVYFSPFFERFEMKDVVQAQYNGKDKVAVTKFESTDAGSNVTDYDQAMESSEPLVMMETVECLEVAQMDNPEPLLVLETTQ